MTPDEQAAFMHLLGAVNNQNAAVTALSARVNVLEQAVQSLHRRLQLQECGTALYEISSGIERGVH